MHRLNQNLSAAVLVAGILTLGPVVSSCGGGSGDSASSGTEATTTIAVTDPSTTSTAPPTTVAPTTAVPETTAPTVATTVAPGADPLAVRYVTDIRPALDLFNQSLEVAIVGNDLTSGGDLAGAADQYTQAESLVRDAIVVLDGIEVPETMVDAHALLRDSYDNTAIGHALSVEGLNNGDPVTLDAAIAARQAGNDLLEQASEAILRGAGLAN